MDVNNNIIVREIKRVFPGAKVVRIMEKKEEEHEEYGPTLNPMALFTKVCDNIGWEKRLNELSREEVTAIIFSIQESGEIKHGSDIQQIKELERTYKQWTGFWPPSTGIPF